MKAAKKRKIRMPARRNKRAGAIKRKVGVLSPQEVIWLNFTPEQDKTPSAQKSSDLLPVVDWK